MEVPERLALIGGSILLSSTLIFTLKSQASQVIPHVGSSISHVFSHIGDTQHDSNFNAGFQQAEHDGRTTGTWGTAKYYIGNNNDLHVGNGILQGNLRNILGDKSRGLVTINIDGYVRAPQNSTRLLTSVSGQSDYGNTLQAIHGLDHIDTSQVTNLDNAFYGEMSLNHLNLNSWDTSHVQGMYETFDDDEGLTDLQINDWNVNSVNNIGFLFWHDKSLSNVDLSGWQTPKLQTMNNIFGDAEQLQSFDMEGFDTTNAQMPDLFLAQGGHQLRKMTLGDHTYLKNIGYLPDGIWQDGSQKLSTGQLEDGNSHPGTWILQ